MSICNRRTFLKRPQANSRCRSNGTAFLLQTETGEYTVGVRGKGNFAMVQIEGKPLAMQYLDSERSQAKAGHVHLEQGKKVAVRVRYQLTKAGPVEAQLIWSRYDPKPSAEAIIAAKNADVVIAVLGITSELEGEEMPVNEDGFKGGDRTSIDLPKPEEELLEAVTAAGKPVILVLANGSAIAVNWANEHVNAIFESWYAGEEGGVAIAETLSGKNNPAGRLPVTFYTGVDQLPDFGDYSMQNRTYRYFHGKPLYPFGYGLELHNFHLHWFDAPEDCDQRRRPAYGRGDGYQYGKARGRGGSAALPQLPECAWSAVASFARLQARALKPGESQKVRFELKERDLSMVSEAGEPIIAEGTYAVSIGGGQPNTGAPTVTGNFRVMGTKMLPE